MPRVVLSRDFRIKMGGYIKSLSSKDSEGYMFIANGVDHSKSFVVISPYLFKEILLKAGMREMEGAITLTLQDVRERISSKYRDIRSKR